MTAGVGLLPLRVPYGPHNKKQHTVLFFIFKIIIRMKNERKIEFFGENTL